MFKHDFDKVGSKNLMFNFHVLLWIDKVLN